MEGDQSSRTEYKGWWEGGESGKLTANEERTIGIIQSPKRGDRVNFIVAEIHPLTPQLDFKILMNEMSVKILSQKSNYSIVVLNICYFSHNFQRWNIRVRVVHYRINDFKISMFTQG